VSAPASFLLVSGDVVFKTVHPFRIAVATLAAICWDATVAESGAGVLLCHAIRTVKFHPVGLEYRIVGLTCGFRAWFDHAAV
jgi:hypothetical protein